MRAHQNTWGKSVTALGIGGMKFNLACHVGTHRVNLGMPADAQARQHDSTAHVSGHFPPKRKDR